MTFGRFLCATSRLPLVLGDNVSIGISIISVLLSRYNNYHDTIIITIVTLKVFKCIFRKKSASFVGKYIACRGKHFFRLTLVASDQLVAAPFFINRKTKVLPHFAFARSVLSLTEEEEDSSVAIFTAWCLAHVHVHACLGVRVWRGGGAGRGLSIDTVYMLIAYHSAYISINISH